MESLAPQSSGQASSSQGRGLLFELGSTARSGLPGAELFEREVQRTLEREGGRTELDAERAELDARRAELSDSRRADRRAGFESEPADRRRPADHEPSQDRQAPVSSAAPSTSGEPPQREPASGPTARAEGQPETAAREGQAAEDGGRRAPREAEGPPPSRGATHPAAAPQPAPAGSTKAPPAALPQVRPQAGASPVVTGVGAAGGLRGTAASGPDATAKVHVPAPPPPPDVEAVERAAEVLRQLRARLSSRGVGGAGREVLLQLAPQELGRLSVRMRLENGTLSTVVRVESAQTLELLERQSPELRALLSQQGFDAEQLDLQLFDDGSSGARRDPAHRPSPRSTALDEEASAVEAIHPTLLPRRAPDANGVDTYA